MLRLTATPYLSHPRFERPPGEGSGPLETGPLQVNDSTVFRGQLVRACFTA
jgi:hypothetical protein